MADRLTSEQRSRNMSRIRGKDTKPEMVIRRLLHGMGFRYRLHRRDLPGSPDIVLPKHMAAIFIHGCFWHGHQCHLFRWPATREEFWRAKIARNTERDTAALVALHAAGWRTLVVWECAVKGRGRLGDAELAKRMSAFVCSTEAREVMAGANARLAGPAPDTGT